jgi:hypothetical protein
LVVDVLAVTCINFVLATQPSGYITEVLPSRLDAVLRYYPAAWVHYRGTPYITEVLPTKDLPRYSPRYITEVLPTSLSLPSRLATLPRYSIHYRCTPHNTLPRYSLLRPRYPAVWLHHRGTPCITEVLPTKYYRGTPYDTLPWYYLRYITEVLSASSSRPSRLATSPRFPETLKSDGARHMGSTV